MPSLKSVDSYAKTRIEAAAYKRIGLAFLLYITSIGIVASVVRQLLHGSVTAYDAQVLQWINSHSSPLLDTLALAVTYTGNLAVVLSIAAILAITLYRRRAYHSMIQIVLTMGGALLLNNLLKVIFQRERPKLWQLFTNELTYSFPSGHALLSMSLAVAVMLLWHRTRYGWLVVAIATIYTLLVGLSRLYLGVHYPTDVMAGWLIGLGWAIIVALLLGTVRIQSRLLQHSK